MYTKKRKVPRLSLKILSEYKKMLLTFSSPYDFPNVTGGVYSREISKFHRGKLIHDYS